MVIDKVTQANQLRVIGNSETFSATTRYINPKKVEAVFFLRRDAKSPRYEKKTLFDFSGVSEEQAPTALDLFSSALHAGDRLRHRAFR